MCTLYVHVRREAAQWQFYHSASPREAGALASFCRGLECFDLYFGV